MKVKNGFVIFTAVTIFLVFLIIGFIAKSSEKEASNEVVLALSNSSNINAKNIKSIDNSLIVKKTEDDKKQVDVATMGNLHKFKSSFGVLVSIDKQKVYIFKNNSLIKTLICSTGIDGSDTPKGSYTIKERGTYFFSHQYGEGGMNWVRFMGDFLFHSVPTDINKNIIPEEATKLGVRASHGCVRLAVDDAKWFYDNVPTGTELVIF